MLGILSKITRKGSTIIALVQFLKQMEEHGLEYLILSAKPNYV